MTDWTTIRATGATTTVVQSETTWLNLGGYRDLVIWLDVRSVIVDPFVNVNLDFQTSPVPDEKYFVTIANQVLAASGTPTILKVLSTATPRLEVWLRWKLYVTGTPSNDWSATFRIHCAVNPARLPA